MIKNQLYPYIEEYINCFLYGFTKEQLDVGLMNGQIKLENLNLRPDGINEELDKSIIPFWLKAGLISKMNFGCSLMNFIGEKPLEANIEGVNIILTPSYKWIIQNLDSFMYEDIKEMKSEYIPYENNSINIFTKKINVLDNSIFKKEKIEEFFKDQTKISNFLNKILLYSFEYYYYKNYSLILKIKNLHIRFEDDQLINYIGNIALGCKIDTFELTLSPEATMKKNNFKISKLDIYWENNANILIPSSLLYNSIKNGELNEIYYTNLKKIQFESFSYKKDTKFIIQNLNCLSNFGTKAMNQKKIDLFGKKENNYKLYVQFASNEININYFPDLNIIKNNFRKFVRDFTIIAQAQEFKPLKKPYSIKNKSFMDIINYINKNKNTSFAKNFLYKKKMIVRDWLYYFYWCYKCKNSLFNYNLNPLRAEFLRYLNLCLKKGGIESYNDDVDKKKIIKKKQIEENGKPVWTKENPNPDNIKLLFTCDIKIKGLNLNLYPLISDNHSNECISIKINNIDTKIALNIDKFEINFFIKNIILGPNKLCMGEKVIISNINKKREINLNNNYNNKTFNKTNNINYQNFLSTEESDSNTGFTGFLKKYNPNYTKQLNIIDKAMEKINTNVKNNFDTVSEMKSEISYQSANHKNIKDNDKVSLNSRQYSNLEENNYTKNKKINFTKKIIKDYEPTPTLQKIELNRQKNEFNISKAINHYNSNKLHQRVITNKNIDTNNKNLTDINEPKIINNSKIIKNQNNTQIISTGQVIPLNLIEIFSNNNSPCISFKYTKINNNSSMDYIQIFIGTIRVNLFSEYLLKCGNIINEYLYSNKKIKIKSIINNMSSSLNDITTKKKLYEMRKYFYENLIKIPEKNKTEQIKNYINYLKNEIEKDKLYLCESDNYEINFLFRIFSNGIEINIDYDNLECIYYNNKNNKICGKAIIPSPIFNLKANSSKISFKLFDFEFEIDDLDNTKLLLKTLHSVLEAKYKMAQLLIEPCMLKIKEDLEKKEMELIQEENNENIKNLENNLKKLKENNLNLNSNRSNFNNEIKQNTVKEDNKNINKIKNHNEKYNKNGVIPTLQDNSESEYKIKNNNQRNSNNNFNDFNKSYEPPQSNHKKNNNLKKLKIIDNKKIINNKNIPKSNTISNLKEDDIKNNLSNNSAHKNENIDTGNKNENSNSKIESNSRGLSYKKVNNKKILPLKNSIIHKKNETEKNHMMIKKKIILPKK